MEVKNKMADYKYRQELKELIKGKLDELYPNKIDTKSTVFQDCPHCCEDEAYIYISEFKYGRCTHCSREDGFEYYNKVMGNRVEEYEYVVNKIKEMLNKL